MNRKIKLIFTLLFLFFGTTVALLSYIINSYYINDSIKKKSLTLAVEELKNKETLLVEFVNKSKNSINILKDGEILKSYIKEKNLTNSIHNSNYSYLQELFISIFKTNSEHLKLRFLDKDANEIIKIYKDSIDNSLKIEKSSSLKNQSRELYFKESKRIKNSKIWISDISLKSKNNKKSVIRFSTPIYLDGEFEGVLVLNVSSENLIEKILHSQIFEVSLFNKFGKSLIPSSEYGNLKEYQSKLHKAILANEKIISKNLMSRNLTEVLDLPKGLVIVLEPIVSKIDSLEKDESKYILSTAFIIFIISFPLALILAKVPTNLNRKLLKAKEKLIESNNLFEQYKRAMDESNIVSKSDLKGNITYVNDKFSEVSLYSKEEVLGKPHSLLRSPDMPKEIFEDLWSTIKDKRVWHGTLKNRKKSGEFYYVDITILPILDKNSKIKEYIAIRHEITEIINKSKELEESLRRDHLTNEGNRFKLIEDISKAYSPALALIDIHRFSEINDFYGHNLGDKVLLAIAKKIKNLILLKNYHLYRLHSDEFAIFCDNENRDTFINYIKTITSSISLTSLKIEQEEIQIQLSSSISFEEKDRLISTASIAKGATKQKSVYTVIYDKSMNYEESYHNNLEWTLKIKKAIKDNRVVPYYQPIYNNHTKKIEKYECLVRLIDEDGTVISPYFFLDIAKKSRQYLKLTRRVIETSFEYFKDKDCEFSINLTVEDITCKELSSFILEQIKKYDNAKKVVFELVESEGIDNFDDINSFITEMKDLGCKIAIDDFGTGYSNFEYLIKLNADYIKIDGSLIKSIHIDKNMEEIVKTIVDFAKKQGFKTIAEFISNEEINSKINELGIDYAQGFLIGKPEAEIL